MQFCLQRITKGSSEQSLTLDYGQPALSPPKPPTLKYHCCCIPAWVDTLISFLTQIHTKGVNPWGSYSTPIPATPHMGNQPGEMPQKRYALIKDLSGLSCDFCTEHAPRKHAALNLWHLLCQQMRLPPEKKKRHSQPEIQL